MTKSADRPFTIASVQIAPEFMDRDGTVKKACEIIAAAAKNGARVIVFPEAFIPAYPDWIWVTPMTRGQIHAEMYGELLDQSVTLPSLAVDKLCRAAKAAGAYVVMGINERSASGGSIYNSLLYISDQGEVMGVHRKLVPTAAERLVWTPGGGDTLVAFDTPYGKLGGLICWENYMPLARYAMYAWGVQIYVAATWDCNDTWVATLRHIAKEGRVIVVGCCIAMQQKDIPERYEFKSLYPKQDAEMWVNVGNSAIVSPERILAGPALAEQTILYAEIDPKWMRGSKFTMDVAGHYARPDVFQLTVNRDPAPIINATEAAAAPAINDARAAQPTKRASTKR